MHLGLFVIEYLSGFGELAVLCLLVPFWWRAFARLVTARQPALTVFMTNSVHYVTALFSY
jgi:hypothetical protein